MISKVDGMQIDNYEQAISLTEKLREALPLQVRPGKQLLQTMADDPVDAKTWLTVDTVMYSGDPGGIMMNLQLAGEDGGTVYSTSLTHLVFDPEHELATEVKDYQRQRIRRLRLQDQSGFAAELLSQQEGLKRKRRRGFGQ